mgnify:CR=1 FL=1
MNKFAIVLAAGKGTRMKSALPKVLHQVAGKSMLAHVLKSVSEVEIAKNVVIVGHEADRVIATLPKGTQFVKQVEQLGTGHAVKMAKETINDEDTIVVLCGDTPLIEKETLEKLFAYHLENEYMATVLTTKVEDPTGYGRVIRDSEGNFEKIVEQKDANEEELAVNEINSGIYCFKGDKLKEALDLLDNNNAQGEYYLTDTMKIIKDKGSKVGVFVGATIEELMGVNSRVQLAQAEAIMRKRINKKHMDNGVTIINPENTYIEANVQIGKDTIIEPGVMLRGNTEIGDECIIGMNSSITNSKIGNFTEIKISTIIDSAVGENTTVGPYAYLRPKSNVGNHVKIGDFVEVKNANIGDYSKASHLSYIGDADVGKDVNIGCGVVFVNYDGKNKFRSVVEDGAFIGSNSNLVAPVHIQHKGYIATGSTITEDVPDGALAIARQRQVVKEGWVARKEAKDAKNNK